MIYVKDNFLNKQLFKELKAYSKDFKKVKTPGKSFWVRTLPQEFIDYLCLEIQNIEKKPIENILAFIREAKINQDNDWRIHCDNLIYNKQPERALVLFIKSQEKELNGTAFWEHIKHGDVYNPKNLEVKEFNRMLNEDANNETKWNLKSIIGYKPNRLLSYPCNYFHSKYPNEFKKPRTVLVMFYKYK
tara:strand:+ start:115 stop:678 length:564 start_codon:yes stop_codon:yes gene_type:complete